jgi:hypothetical protein
LQTDEVFQANYVILLLCVVPLAAMAKALSQVFTTNIDLVAIKARYEVLLSLTIDFVIKE